MRLVNLLIISFLCNVGLSQHNADDLSPRPVKDRLTGLLVYEMPEDYAVYDGGNSTLLLDLTLLFSNNSAEYDPYEITRINLGFIVTADGEVVGARIKGKSFEELNSFELHAVKSVERHLSGKWTPGKVDGVNINQLMYYPMNIHLQ